MFHLLVATVVLAVAYGFFWHNQPAGKRDRAPEDRDQGKGGLARLF